MNAQNLALVPLCIALNVALGGLVHVLKLPIYYDAVGTIMAAMLLGFIPAAIVGAISFLVMSILVSPVYVYFIGTQVVIALYVYSVATLFAGFKTLFRSTVSGVGLGLVAGVVSAPVIVYVFGGASGSGRDLLTAVLAASGQQVLKSVLLSGAASEPIDKTIQVLTAVLLIRGLPASIRDSFLGGAVAKNFAK